MDVKSATDANALQPPLINKDFPRSPKSNRKRLINFTAGCIKEEDHEELAKSSQNAEELPEKSNIATISSENSVRIRKNTDRLFSNLPSIGITRSAGLTEMNSSSNITAKPPDNINFSSLAAIRFQRKFSSNINPQINIEKSLGSSDVDAMILDTSKKLESTLRDSTAKFNSDLPIYASSRRRKMSLPTFPMKLEVPVPIRPRERSASPARKFSSVSDVVTRKISTTIGWRTPASDEVIPQAKYICTQYIRSRLKRSGLLNKRLGLQRMSSIANMAGGYEVCEVFPRISCIGLELERAHPTVYSSVVRQLGIALKGDKVVRQLIAAVSSHILPVDHSWARIISLFAVAAALAADCVKQGHPEYVSSIIDAVGVAVEDHSVQWVVSQGGWSGVLKWSQPPAVELTPLEIAAIVGGVGVLIAALLGGAIALFTHLLL